ncbi:MAG: cysteine desulfurase NifS [Candidatus Aenigmatarchaeota archaeon]
MKKIKNKIYLDNAATTPVDPNVLKAMKPYFNKKYGNASSLHSFGREAHEALTKSRETIANFLNVQINEIKFTSCGTESNNLALKGIAFANKDKGKHIITSKIEHHCILEVCEWLKKHGFDVTYLPVDKYGFVNPNDVENAIRKDTILVSIMHANNEIGTIEPIDEIGKICKDHDVYFHTDAVQSFGKIPINTKNIDLVSISSHKIYGPKGVGALMIKNDVKIEPLLHGGGHEFGLRSGTENVAGIVGFAKAVEICKKTMKNEEKRQIRMRDTLIKNILKIENSFLNGHPTKRLPNNVNVCFKFIEGESLVLRLDDYGIAASTGSACSSKSLEPSHVLLAIGLKHEEAHGSLRLTLGRQNTNNEIKYVLEVIPKIVEELRKISPFKKSFAFKATKGFENK